MTKVFVSDVRFHAYHGVTEEERKNGHPVSLDVEADVEEDACRSDDVADTVDYGDLSHVAVSVLTREPHHTLERALDVAGRELMFRFPRIQRLVIRLAKLDPPIESSAREAGVERTFVRT